MTVNEPASPTRIAAPMTFGQLSVLRSLEVYLPSSQGEPSRIPHFPAEPVVQVAPETAAWRHVEAHLLQFYPIPPGVGVPAAADAWHKLVARHESLRTTYTLDGAAPVQIVHPFEAKPLPVVPLTGDGSIDEVLEVAKKWATILLEVTTQAPHRAFVATFQGTPRYLTVVLHHVSADGVGCAILEREYAALLAGAELPPASQPRRLAVEQQMDVSGRRATAEYWAEKWPLLEPADRVGGDFSERTQAAFFTERGLRAATEVASRLGVTVQSVVLATTYLVVMRARGVTRMSVGLITSNRVDQKWESMVTSMAQLAPLTAELDLGMESDEFIRWVYRESLETYGHARFQVDELENFLADAGNDDPDTMHFDMFFNFVGESGISLPDDGATVRLDRIRSLRQSGARFNLIVETGTGLFLLMRTSRDFLDPEASDTVLLAVEAGLIHLAEQVPTTLGDLSLRPVREVRPPDGG